MPVLGQYLQRKLEAFLWVPLPLSPGSHRSIWGGAVWLDRSELNCDLIGQLDSPQLLCRISVSSPWLPKSKMKVITKAIEVGYIHTGSITSGRTWLIMKRLSHHTVPPTMISLLPNSIRHLWALLLTKRHSTLACENRGLSIQMISSIPYNKWYA